MSLSSFPSNAINERMGHVPVAKRLSFDPHEDNLALFLDGNRSVPGADTAIAHFMKCLHHPRTRTHYVPGVGSPLHILDRTIGAALGLGINRQAILALEWLVDQYEPNRKIYVIDYSRGGLVGNLVLEFLDRVGLPHHTSRQGVTSLYTQWIEGELDDDAACLAARVSCRCRKLEIQAHLSFDTVSTVWIPRTGIFKYLPRHNNKHNEIVAVPKNVVHSFHGLALLERRAAFIHSLLYLSPSSPTNQTLNQMWFAATHYEVGKAPVGVSSLNDAPLAWGISMLWNAGLPFDNEALQDRFPFMGCTIVFEELPRIMNWAGAETRRTYKGWWKLLGHSERVSNEKNTLRERTNEEIHATVLLRGFGAKRGEEPVAKHHYSKSRLSWSSESTGDIPMNRLTPIEEHLLGLRLTESCP